MDQIYLSKLRPPGFAIGDAVKIIPTKRKKRSFYTHNLDYLEPVKNIIKDEIFDYFTNIDNVVITGSFLEEGFNFNDIDVLLIDSLKADKGWEQYFKQKLGISIHFINLSRGALLKGLSTDPLFQMMMSRYIAKKREIFKFKIKFNYKVLDLHLLKSKSLLDDFEVLTGKEKYDLVRNLLAIKLFLENRELDGNLVDKEIKSVFGEGIVGKLKKNMLEKEVFIKKFKKVYNQTFDKIMQGLKNESK